MNEHDKQVSSVEATANAEPSKGRRRFVKGAIIAMPAVMVIMRGRLAVADDDGDGDTPAVGSACLNSAVSSMNPNC